MFILTSMFPKFFPLESTYTGRWVPLSDVYGCVHDVCLSVCDLSPTLVTGINTPTPDRPFWTYVENQKYWFPGTVLQTL